MTIIVGLIILNALVNMLVNSIWPVGENPLKLLMRVGTGFTLGMFITAYYASKTQ